MARTLSSAEAKARFAECLRTAEQGRSLLITRHGKPVAALVSAADLDQFERLRAAGPKAGLAGIAGGWKGSDKLVTRVLTAKRARRRRPRAVLG